MTEPSVNNGSGEKWVDLQIYDDHVVLSGTKIMREKYDTIKDFRMFWEFYKVRLRARGSIKGTNDKNTNHFKSDMDLFQKMVNRSFDEGDR
jgi:hypothetical protein